MARVNERRPCAKCKTAGGIAICDGCNRSFCSNHFIEHRQDLALEMDTIGQNYDELCRDLSAEPKEHSLVARINTWEQDAIDRIKKAAATARDDLQILINQIKTELVSTAFIVVTEIKTSRDSNDFTEGDFQRWTEQLKELRRAFEAPFNVYLENDTNDETSINLIRIFDERTAKCIPANTMDEVHTPSTPRMNIFLDAEKFDMKTDAILSDDNLRALCHPKFRSPGVLVYGYNTYSCGTHDISFRIEKKGISRLFFGIYSDAKKRIDSILGDDNTVYGWWDINSSVINGMKQESSNEQIISTGDKVVLTIDCNNQQIHLYHVRDNRTVQITIDTNKCPFPWRIIVKLTASGDCVRIL